MIWPLFRFWGRNLSNFSLVFWKIEKNQKDILKLTDLYQFDNIQSTSSLILKFCCTWSTYFPPPSHCGRLKLRFLDVSVKRRVGISINQTHIKLENRHNPKYSRLRCLLRVKGLVICFYLNWSGSTLQFRQNIIKVGWNSWLLTCNSNTTLSLPSYTGSTLKRELNFCKGYLSLLYFWSSVYPNGREKSLE